MSEKLIIDNRSKQSMQTCLRYARAVIVEGKVSETAGRSQYCFHMSFGGGMHASAFVNAKSDRIVIHHNDGKDWQAND